MANAPAGSALLTPEVGHGYDLLNDSEGAVLPLAEDVLRWINRRELVPLHELAVLDRVDAVSGHLVEAGAAVDGVSFPVAGGDRVVAALGLDPVPARRRE